MQSKYFLYIIGAIVLIAIIAIIIIKRRQAQNADATTSNNESNRPGATADVEVPLNSGKLDLYGGDSTVRAANTGKQ